MVDRFASGSNLGRAGARRLSSPSRGKVKPRVGRHGVLSAGGEGGRRELAKIIQWDPSAAPPMGARCRGYGSQMGSGGPRFNRGLLLRG